MRLASRIGVRATTWLWSDWQEQCPSCLQSYAMDMGRRCAECDGVVCPFCIVAIEAQWVCGACKESADDSPRDVEG
jgi:hypothetical protein